MTLEELAKDAVTVDPKDEKEKFILAIETEIAKAVNCLETGNEYEGILSLKGIQFAVRCRRESATQSC